MIRHNNNFEWPVWSGPYLGCVAWEWCVTHRYPFGYGVTPAKCVPPYPCPLFSLFFFWVPPPKIFRLQLQNCLPQLKMTNVWNPERDEERRSSNPNLYSFSGRTTNCKTSWSLEAARFGFRFFQSLWNLTGSSAAPQPRCLSSFRAIRSSWHPIPTLRDLAVRRPSP